MKIENKNGGGMPNGQKQPGFRLVKKIREKINVSRAHGHMQLTVLIVKHEYCGYINIIYFLLFFFTLHN